MVVPCMPSLKMYIIDEVELGDICSYFINDSQFRKKLVQTKLSIYKNEGKPKFGGAKGKPQYTHAPLGHYRLT